MSPQKNLGNQTVFKRGYYVGKIAMAIKIRREHGTIFETILATYQCCFPNLPKKEKKWFAYYLLCELVKLFDQVLLEFVQNISKREKIKLYTQI